MHYRDRGIRRELVRRWSEQHRRQPSYARVQAAAQGPMGTCAPAFLERVAAELRRKDLGDGLVHRVAYQVARSITWDAGRTG